jgi:hypothetical protein
MQRMGLFPLSKKKLHISLVYLIRIIFILLHLLFILLHLHIYFTYIHTLCLTATRWSWGHKTRKLFCRLLDENEESVFNCFPKVRYKPRVSSWEKFTLARTLCTWSPNELAPCLVSSVWRMALALCFAIFGTTYMVIYTLGVSCWAPLEVRRGVRSAGRFLVVLGFWWRCAFDGGVTRRV